MVPRPFPWHRPCSPAARLTPKTCPFSSPARPRVTERAEKHLPIGPHHVRNVPCRARNPARCSVDPSPYGTEVVRVLHTGTSRETGRDHPAGPSDRKLPPHPLARASLVGPDQEDRITAFPQLRVRSIPSAGVTPRARCRRRGNGCTRRRHAGHEAYTIQHRVMVAGSKRGRDGRGLRG